MRLRSVARPLLTPALVLTALLPSATAHAATAAVEGEGMRAVHGRVALVQDATASARRAAALSAGTSLDARIARTSADDVLHLTVRAGSAVGARLHVTVDGRRHATLTVTDRAWRTHTVRGPGAVGDHTVRLSAATPGRERSGRVLVDRIAYAAAGSTSRSPQPGSPQPGSPQPGSPQPRTPAAPPATSPSPTAHPDAFEARLLELANVERVRAGVPPLAVSACATGFAEDWSQRMATTGVLEHRPDLSELLRACSASRVGENIAYGDVTADRMTALWMASPGHRANLLDPAVTHIGVGAVRTATGRVYGTQNLLRLG